jgi:hypothetical protein
LLATSTKGLRRSASTDFSTSAGIRFLLTSPAATAALESLKKPFSKAGVPQRAAITR